METYRWSGGIAPLLPMEASGQFHVPAALSLDEAGCVSGSGFFGGEMNMFPLPGTVDDCWLRREYGSGCRVLAVPGGSEKWRTEGGFGVFKPSPPTPKFRRSSKIVPKSTRL